MIQSAIDNVGHLVLKACDYLGKMTFFLRETVHSAFTTSFKLKKAFYQAQHVGVNSFTVIFLTGTSVGSVLAYQSYVGLHRFGG